MVITKTYRKWELIDLQAIRDITWKTWIDSYSRFIPIEDIEIYYREHYSLSALTSLYLDGSVDGFIGLVNNSVVAYEKNKYAEDEQRYYVSSLYVLPNFQGMGIGKDLMALAEKRAQSKGLDRIWLGVMLQNIKSLDWYRKLGFIFVEELPFIMGNTSVKHVIGYKTI